MKILYFLLGVILCLGRVGYSQTDIPEIPKNCIPKDCYKVSIISNVSMDVDFDVNFFKNPSNFTGDKSLLRLTSHSAMAIDGEIFDFPGGMWSLQQKFFEMDYNRKLPLEQLLQFSPFMERFKGNNFYVYSVYVSGQTVESLKIYWSDMILKSIDFDVQSFNCHMAVANAIRLCFSSESNPKDIFKDQVQIDRWGVFLIPRCIDNIYTECGSQKGTLGSLSIFEMQKNENTTINSECNQCRPIDDQISDCDLNESPQVNQGDNGLIEEPGLFNFSVYPNPSNGLINIDIECDTIESLYYGIIDLYGSELYTGYFEQGLIISGLKPGIYFVRLFNNDYFLEKRIAVVN